MAVQKKKSNEPVWTGPPPETIVDVVSIKCERVIVTPMRYDEAKNIKAFKNGWTNNIFQQGFHNYKTTEINGDTRTDKMD